MNLCGSGGDAAAGVTVMGRGGNNTRPRFLADTDANDKPLQTSARMLLEQCRDAGDGAALHS